MLIKLDMPEVNLEPVRELRRLEVYQHDTKEWRRATMEAIALDGRARLRWDDNPARLSEVDLAEEQFRWLAGEAVQEWDAHVDDAVAEIEDVTTGVVGSEGQLPFRALDWDVME